MFASNCDRPTQKEAPPPTKVKIGDIAPDFTLVDQNGQPHSLHDYKGKKSVALAFFVWSFSPNGTKEMRSFQENVAKLEAADTQVLGVSMDSPFASKAFADQNGVTFPLRTKVVTLCAARKLKG
jgi:peroxiredoxin